MQYLKKIESVNRTDAILKGLMISAAAGAVLMGMVMLAGTPKPMLMVALAVLAVFALAAVLVGVLVASNQNKTMQKRVAALEPTASVPFEQAQFAGVSDEVLLGNDWLVGRKGTNYSFWTREIISRIEVRQQKESSDKGVLEVYIKGSPNPEQLPVTAAQEVRTQLQSWLGV